MNNTGLKDSMAQNDSLSDPEELRDEGEDAPTEGEVEEPLDRSRR